MDEVVLNYTERCNSHCSTCYLWKLEDPQTLGLEAIERLFQSPKLAGLRNLYLTGGEPFLTDECVEIARLLKRYLPGTIITGATNGLDPQEYFRRICAIKFEVGVWIFPSVSLNGDRQYHDRSRGTRGSYDRALELMRLLTDSGCPYDISYLEIDQDESQPRHVREVAASLGVGIQAGCMRFSSRFNHRITSEATADFNCLAPVEILYLFPDGRVTTCEMDDPELELGNINQQTLEEMDFERVTAYVQAGRCKPCSMHCYNGKWQA